MLASTCTTVVGVFAGRNEANRAIEELGRAGFSSGQIGLLARDHGASDIVKQDGSGVATNIENGAIAGAAAGAGIGGLVGLGVLAGVIPVVGPAIAAGTLAVLLSNAVGGAAIASLSGALIAWGVPEQQAAYYDAQLNAGRVIVSVTTSERCEVARSILERNSMSNQDLFAQVP